jgi:hypothetical protein
MALSPAKWWFNLQQWWFHQQKAGLTHRRFMIKTSVQKRNDLTK